MPAPGLIPSMSPLALWLADHALDLPTGEEGIEQRLDDLLVGIGEVFDGLELTQQFAIGDARGGGFIGCAVEQIIAGGIERVGEALEAIAAGARSAALEPPDMALSEQVHRFAT